MSLALLTPLALGLLALLVGPLLVHLVRQRPNNQHAFGAMLLLRRLERKLRRRRKLQDLLLLLLRLLAVLLVVLAAAGPELRWPGEPEELGQAGAVVIILDDSLSMDQEIDWALTDGAIDNQRRTLFTEARSSAIELVKGLPDGVLVGAVTIGGSAEGLVSTLTADHGTVSAALVEVRQSQGRTDLSGGLRLARRMLAGKGGEVIVLNDEAGPVAVPAAREEIALLTAQGGALRPRPLSIARPANVSVLSAVYGNGPEGGSVTIELMNFGESVVEVSCTVRLPDGAEITTFVEIDAAATAEATVTVPRVADGGVGIVEIDDGSVAVDDAFAFHLPRIGASRVLVVDGDPGLTPTDSEVYFLERALAPWGTASAARGGVLPDVTSSAGITTLDPEEHRVVFLSNLDDPAAIAGRVVDFVRRGGGLVISMGDNVTVDRYNAAFADLLPAPLRRPRALANYGEPGIPTALPDTGTELFRPFSRGGLSAFSRARWQRIFTLEPYNETDTVSTLMSLEGGVPLLVERKVGRGRVLLMTGTFDLGWGNLPLQAVYMPLIQRLVGYLGGETGGGGERLSGVVGDPVVIPVPDTSIDLDIIGPAGPVAAHVSSSGVSFTPDRIGAYSVQTPGAPPLAWVAVNVDPVESDVRRGPSLIETAADVAPERFLHRKALSPGLILAALGLALLQAVLAVRRRKAEAEDVQ
ncbi:MAG: VWA domain-containing protein [Myxococcota bacterium]|nr:VWA domain-containing protein [Myxococcota bacterium]